MGEACNDIFLKRDTGVEISCKTAGKTSKRILKNVRWMLLICKIILCDKCVTLCWQDLKQNLSAPTLYPLNTTVVGDYWNVLLTFRQRRDSTYPAWAACELLRLCGPEQKTEHWQIFCMKLAFSIDQRFPCKSFHKCFSGLATILILRPSHLSLRVCLSLW